MERRRDAECEEQGLPGSPPYEFISRVAVVPGISRPGKRRLGQMASRATPAISTNAALGSHVTSYNSPPRAPDAMASCNHLYFCKPDLHGRTSTDLTGHDSLF